MKKIMDLKNLSVAFTGHRDIPVSLRKDLKIRIKIAVILAYSNGFRRFYCGMAQGFDMMAAEIVLSLKKSNPDIKLITIVPFKAQASRWSLFERKRYHLLLSKADEVVVLSADYFHGCLLKRNDYMLEHSCSVIAYFDGLPKGGTYYTCKKAKKLGLKVMNVYNSGGRKT